MDSDAGRAGAARERANCLRTPARHSLAAAQRLSTSMALEAIVGRFCPRLPMGKVNAWRLLPAPVHSRLDSAEQGQGFSYWVFHVVHVAVVSRVGLEHAQERFDKLLC